jgi:hypothetical protein
MRGLSQLPPLRKLKGRNSRKGLSYRPLWTKFRWKACNVETADVRSAEITDQTLPADVRSAEVKDEALPADVRSA